MSYSQELIISTEPDMRIETILKESFSILYGRYMILGKASTISEELNIVGSLNLYELFNKNVIDKLESDFIQFSEKREFYFNFFTSFMTLLKIRHLDLNFENVLSKFNYISIINYQPNIVLKKEQARLYQVKGIQDSVYTLNENDPIEYIKRNEHYLMVVLMNIFYMELIDCVSSILGDFNNGE